MGPPPQERPSAGLRRRIVLAAVDGVQSKDIAERLACSRSTLGRIWRAFGLKPHRALQALPDPPFIDKVRDIVGLYLNPPDAAVVLRVDEKSQVQALDRSSPVLPLMPGVPERHTHDYLPHGTTNLFAALDVASGQVIAEMTPVTALRSSAGS